MATVPAVVTFVAGATLTAAQLNTNLRDAINFIITPPLAVLRQTVGQSLTSGTGAVITFDTEDVDRDGGHSVVSNTGRYTAQTAGYYHAAGVVSFGANASGRRAAYWTVNGSAVDGGRISLPPNSGTDTQVPALSRPIYLNVGDYLELAGLQDSGGSLNTYVALAAAQSVLTVRWVST